MEKAYNACVWVEALWFQPLIFRLYSRHPDCTDGMKERVLPMTIKSQNKWVRGAIPALLLHCSIGTVYCWSTFSSEIATYIQHTQSAVEWAFSLAIFFLGMSAAFLGNVVEKNIHRSSLIASICFGTGMVGSGLFMMYGKAHPGSPVSLIGILVCYGFIMGVGLGTGYLSPVKTLMLWFSENKGLATGLAVAGFGAAKAIATPIMQGMIDSGMELPVMFIILGCVYFVMMFIGHILLAKPAGWHEPTTQEKGARAIDVIKQKPVVFAGIWLMFYLNITCGLALISQEKMIYKAIGLAGSVGVLGVISAIFNAGGRFFLSAAADKMKDRNTMYKLIFIVSLVITAAVVLTQGIVGASAGSTVLTVLVLALVFLVNAGYGGGFSNVPTLLSDHYGMQNISAIHGITLSAWGFAGLTGNQLAGWIVSKFGEVVEIGGYKVNPQGYQTVLYVTLALYAVALCASLFLVGGKKKEKN